MEIFFKFLLFLLCAFLSGVSSQNCNRCQGCCFITANSTALCKCDEGCQEFGDCCGENSPSNSSLTSVISSLEDGVKLDCHSIITVPNTEVTAENEAFLMVSSCPHSWLDPENSSIESNCSMPSQSLPPVTDVTTGLVYRNKYCAQCNRVTQLVAWSSRLICSEEIKYLIFDFMLEDPDILKRECSSCSFVPPNTTNTSIPPPRSCIPRVETCLPPLKLETKTKKSVEERNHTTDVRECQLGSLDLVRSGSGIVYRNKACATCNSESITECFDLKLRDICDPDSGCKIPERTAEVTKDVTTKTPPINTTAITEMNITDSTNETNVSAQSQEDDGEVQPLVCSPSLSFTITLSSLGGGKMAVSVGETTSIFTPCKSGELRLGTECISMLCPEGFIITERGCLYVGLDSELSLNSLQDLNLTSMNCSTQIKIVDNESYIDLNNGTIFLKEAGLTMEVLDYDDLGRPIICQQIPHLKCSSGFILLNESEYMILDNNSVVIGGRVVEARFRDKYGRPLICPDLINSTFNNTINGLLLATLPGIQELTYIGCSLSVLGAVAVFLTYSIFSELQTFPGLVLMNLCAPIFSTSLLFIIGGPVIQYHPLKEICSTLAIVLHYFYLSQFSWMSIFSFEMTKTFYQARKLVQDSRQTKCKYLIIYLTVGWILPLVISTITIVVNFTTNGLVLYGVNSHGQIAGCWINHYQSFIIAFVLPLVLSLSCNLVLFVITTVLLCRAYKDQAKVDKSNIFTMTRVWLAVFTITGLTWIFGFVAILHELSWMWYLFVICNSTQGFSIFLTFIFTKKVLNLYKKLLRKKFKMEFFFSRKIRTTRSTMVSTTEPLQDGKLQATNSISN